VARVEALYLAGLLRVGPQEGLPTDRSPRRNDRVLWRISVPRVPSTHPLIGMATAQAGGTAGNAQPQQQGAQCTAQVEPRYPRQRCAAPAAQAQHRKRQRL